LGRQNNITSPGELAPLCSHFRRDIAENMKTSDLRRGLRARCAVLLTACALLPWAGTREAAAQPGVGELISYDLAALMNVEVISASKELQPANEAPGTVRVITREQIKERGYLTLEEALAGLPGFQFRNISGFNSYVFLRGVPNQNNLLLVLVDGVQINELNSGGFYAGAQYNLANVERIEVVYGPASALYGTNAMSGVINIITRDPRDIPGGEGSALAGSYGSRAVDFSYGHNDKERDYGLSLSGKLARTAKDNLRGTKGDNNWSGGMENFEEDQSFDGKLLYKDFTLGAVVQDKNSSIATNEKTTGSDLVDFGTQWHIRFSNAYLKHLYAAPGGWSLESRLYYRNATVLDDTITRVYATVCSTCGQQGQYRPNELYGVENQFRLAPAERLDFTAGLAAEHENLAQNLASSYSGDPLVKPPAPGAPGMVSNDLLSLYVQARYGFTEELKLTAGVRHDSSSSYGKVDTPRAGLVYNRAGTTLKLLYGEAFRAPRPWDYTYGLGNPSLDPEKLYSLELSGAYAFSSNLRGDVSLYRNRLSGPLTLSGNRWVNSGGITTRGAEVRVELARGSLKTYLNYAFQSSEDAAGADVPEIGRHNAGAGLFYSFSRKAGLDLSGRYIGRCKNPKTIAATGNDKVAAAVVADAALSFAFGGGMDVRFLAKNLFDLKYYDTSNRAPDRYRQPQRQLLLQVGYAFGTEKPR